MQDDVTPLYERRPANGTKGGAFRGKEGSRGWFPGFSGRHLLQRGKTMLPGFIDAHGHFPWNGNDELYGVKLYNPPIGTINNIEEMLAALKRKAKALKPGEWVLGRGYDNSLLTDNRHPPPGRLRQSFDHLTGLYRAHLR
jgi:hypothetical protein